MKNLDNMDGHQFEDLIELLIHKMGFITEERKKSADGGIDIYAINEQPIYKGKYIIQCKRYSKNIGVSTIRDLYGVISSEKANKGILITNSQFTQTAKDFANDNQIELIDGEKLSTLISKYELERSLDFNNKNEVYEINIPESYLVTTRVFKSGIEKILNHKEKIKRGIVFIDKKDWIGEGYLNYLAEKKLTRLSNIIQTHTNQLNYLNELWNKSKNVGEKYTNLIEIKAHSQEIIRGIELIESEWEEVLSYEPPETLSTVKVLFLELYEGLIEQAGINILNFTKTIEAYKGEISPEDIKLNFNFVLDIPEGWLERLGTAIEQATEELKIKAEEIRLEIENSSKHRNEPAGCLLMFLVLFGLTLSIFAVA